MFFTYAREDSYQQVHCHKSNSNSLVDSRKTPTPVSKRSKSNENRLSRESVDMEDGGSPCVDKGEEDIDVMNNQETVENGLSGNEQDSRDFSRTSPRKRPHLESGHSSRQSSRSSSRNSSRSSSRNRVASTSNNPSPVHSPTRESRKRRSTSSRS